MPEMNAVWLRCAAALYGFALLEAMLALWRVNERFARIAAKAFQVAVVLHAVSVVERSASLGQLAANNFFETASLCALFVAGGYLWVEARSHSDVLRICIFPLVALLTLIAALGTGLAGWSDLRVRGAWLLVHILLILVGYTALLFSAAAALLYLLQERRLKRRGMAGQGRLERLLSAGRALPLETLDGLITSLMSAGFAAVTLGVVAGSTWASIEYGTRWIGQPKIIVSLLTWAFYLVMLFLRVSAGWRGRRAAVLSLAALGCSALTWAAHVGLQPLLEK